MDVLRFLQFHYAPRRTWQIFVILPVIGLMVALLGPFGTYLNMPVPVRCLHFMLTFILIGLLQLEGAYRLSRSLFKGYWPFWAALLLDLALVLPAATIVYASLAVLYPIALPHVRFTNLLWQNLVLMLVVQAVVLAVGIYRQTRLAEAPAPAPNEDFPLADALPFALKHSRVLALSSEDHYLRVYTSRGEALVHMTLADAMERLPDGCQIHRSHWVSAGAIKDYKDTTIELATGLRLPVSRQRRKPVETWLESISPAQ